MRHILHSYRRCPFCIRVRIVLHLKGVAYEVVEEPLRKWTTWMKKWSEGTNERPRVPVLRMDNGVERETILTESNSINMYLDRAVQPVFTLSSRWYDESRHVEMKRWMRWCDEELKPQIDLFKYGEGRIFNRDAHSRHTATLHSMLELLEEPLSNRPHLLGERIDLADIAIIPFIRQIMRTREGEFNFSGLPHVEAWTRSIIDTEWFQNEVMKKYPLAPSHEDD